MSEPNRRVGIGIYLFALAAIFTLWAGSGVIIWNMIGKPDGAGTFGDMFGAVNALFSGLAFATLIYAAWMQREELSMQRQELRNSLAELAGQREQLRLQNETFQLQRFEDSLFALLQAHAGIVQGIDLGTTRGRAAFQTCYSVLKSTFSQSIGEATSVNNEMSHKAAIKLAFNSFFDAQRHEAELTSYFRHLFHIFDYVMRGPSKEVDNYLETVRAQLSPPELVILFYYGLSEHANANTKELIENCSIFDRLPLHLLFDDLHFKFYRDFAYGM